MAAEAEAVVADRQVAAVLLVLLPVLLELVVDLAHQPLLLVVAVLVRLLAVVAVELLLSQSS